MRAAWRSDPLAERFGTSAEFWLTLQMTQDLATVRRAARPLTTRLLRAGAAWQKPCA